MKKILYVATVVKTHIMQFHIPYLKMLKETGWETAVAARNDYENPEDCRIPYCDAYYDIPFERSPFNLQNIKTCKMLKKIIEEGDYDIVHCHTPMGSVLARVAARKMRGRGCRVIYTAHGFHFFKGAPLKNWIFYYPVERFLSRWTDVLITINKEDYARAKKHMHAKHVEYVPGVGIDLQKFAPDNFLQEEKEELRKSLGVGENDKLLLSVGELIKRKNHETVIRAIAKLKDPHIKYYICGSGELMGYLQKLIGDLQLSESVKLLGYRTDISELCECTDLFVFPSLQEGLPVALMEAVASKAPVIGSNIRGNTDLLSREALFDCRDVEGIAEKIKVYLTADRSEEAERNYRNLQKYDIRNVISDMRELYLSEGKAFL